MKYRYLLGPNAGQIVDLVPHHSLVAMQGAGLIEPVREPAKPKPTATINWSLNRISEEVLDVVVCCSACGRKEIIATPTPKYRFGCCGAGPEGVPQWMFEKYGERWERARELRVRMAKIQAQQDTATEAALVKKWNEEAKRPEAAPAVGYKLD